MVSLKWADVAHMYAESRVECYLEFTYADTSKNRKSTTAGLFVLHTLKEMKEGRCYATPILRHLEDITEAEALELYEIAWGFPMELQTSVWDSARDWFQSLLEKYAPKTTFWLYKNGFDIHGLIESGEAIRKVVDNGR